MTTRVFEIVYDLRSAGQDYDGVKERIKEVMTGGGWLMQSTYVITSEHTAAQIRDHIRKSLDTNDKLLVTKLVRNWASWGLSDKWNEWLKTNLAAYAN